MMSNQRATDATDFNAGGHTAMVPRQYGREGLIQLKEFMLSNDGEVKPRVEYVLQPLL
jgi:hypothetical protein